MTQQAPKFDQSTERFWFLRRPTQFIADVVVLSIAFLVAYLPALNMRLGEFYLDTAINQLPFVVLVQFSSLFLVGSYSIIWRYVSLEDIKTFIKAAVLSSVILLVARFALSMFEFNAWQIPISVILIARMMLMRRRRCWVQLKIGVARADSRKLPATSI
mgnify:CR=1 FL=1